MFKRHKLVQVLVFLFGAVILTAAPLPNNPVKAQSDCGPCQNVSCRPVGNGALLDHISSATATVRSGGTVDFSFTINAADLMTINQPCSYPDGLEINGGANICGPSACTQVLQGFNTVTMSVTYCSASTAMQPCFTIKYQSGGALGIIRPRMKSFEVVTFTPSAHTVNVPVNILGNLVSV